MTDRRVNTSMSTPGPRIASNSVRHAAAGTGLVDGRGLTVWDPKILPHGEYLALGSRTDIILASASTRRCVVLVSAVVFDKEHCFSWTHAGKPIRITNWSQALDAHTVPGGLYKGNKGMPVTVPIDVNSSSCPAWYDA